MPVQVRPITLWRAEVDNQPGALAQTLEPLAAAGADLQVVMCYRLPTNRTRAVIEVFPLTGARALSAAQAAGLSEAAIRAVQVEGGNRSGLGHAVTKTLADAGINIDFFLGQVIGRSHTTVIGFDTREDAERAIPLIKAAAGAPRRAAGRKAVGRTGRRAGKRSQRAARRRR